MALRWPLLTVPWLVIIVIPYFALAVPLYLVIITITLPYTLFYRSSNWSMRERDMPAIQLYLDRFQSLYPDLLSAIVTAHRSGLSPHRRPPSAIDFWPTRRNHQMYCIPMIGSVYTRHYEYSQITGFFIALESTGWSRRVLLTFLRDQVEQRPGLVRPEEKETFAMVMEKLCAHDFNSWMANALGRPLSFLVGWTEVWKEWDGDVPVGMRAIHVGSDSVDWVLERGAFLIPQDIVTRNHMNRLSQSAALPMWKRVKNAEDLQMGLGNYWQIMAVR